MEIKRDLTKPLLETQINGGFDETKSNISQHIERQHVDDLTEALLKTEQGRVFIGMLLSVSGYFNNSFVDSARGNPNGEADINKCVFFQGRASIGEYVHGMVYNFNKSEPYVHECIKAYNQWFERLAKEKDSLTAGILKTKQNTGRKDIDGYARD